MSRSLILASKLGYQTRSFAEAAKALGVDVVFGSDRCHQLEDPWSDGAIALRFDQPEESARRIVQQSLVRPVNGLIALGDRATTTAAYAARALGIVNGIGSLGQLVSAYVVAIVVNRFGWDQLFTFFVLCAAAAGGLLTLRWNKGLEQEKRSL